MRKGRVRRAFPGNNTSEGFFSFFEHIIGPEAKRVFIIKGGPGTGKSTFMKNTGLDLVDRGYDVEFFYCSSDNDSLDAIAVPAVGAAIIDGTAPHRVVSTQETVDKPSR
ncbi:MAG: ATPase [Peptococcaceae bacterium]|nr:ATPase [Peptococcaceae bacterium]MDH7526323.1 ATPase [Peptococcaceae bacterium]